MLKKLIKASVGWSAEWEPVVLSKNCSFKLFLAVTYREPQEKMWAGQIGYY